MTEHLRDALHAEAARHRPDRDAILARVAAGQDPERRSRARTRRTPPRSAGLAAAGALLLVATVTGTWTALGRHTTATSVAAPSVSSRQQGFLWSDGSVAPGSDDSRAQSEVTLTTRYTVSALDVRLRIALTPGLAATGQRSSAQGLAVTVTRQGGFLLYEWTLGPGTTLPPGTYTFTARYDHAPGRRDAGRDDYAATATGHGRPVSVQGDFHGH
ncbi:hypothetical protein DN069_08450 [Streptacidiphilus pinicola]|uniref:Uncharacterized protein n=1 Tax=Streptacidiphilus pinicola TaxID=2219663 RepID=A0A2X0JEN1_9ACTN|nr:hypothetical protein [Streptacidiphilus pinicola]RAG86038.1 hypothetical protein DN069_08450 [Streptacidiphilus pinicola]